MKLKFTDKLKTLVNAFDEEPSNSSLVHLRQSYKRNEDTTGSLFSTGSSYTSSKATGFKPQMTTEYNENAFQTVDYKISQLQQKLSIQARNALVTPRKSTTLTEDQKSRNKIKRKLSQMHKEYFNQANRLCHLNKPIACLENSLFSSKTIELNSPTQKKMTRFTKSDLNDMFELAMPNSNANGKGNKKGIMRTSINLDMDKKEKRNGSLLLSNPKTKQYIGLHFNLDSKKERKSIKDEDVMSYFNAYYNKKH